MQTPLARSWRPPLPGVPRTERGCAVVALALAAGMAASCGHKPASSVIAPAIDPPRSGARISALDLAGQWRWSMVTEEAGVRRVEVERWRLQAHGSGIRGTYERTVTFLAQSGVPFTCNQDLSYELRTVYQVEGRDRDDAGVELRELDYQTAPSPCDTGHRSMTSYHYRGERVGQGLVLRWPGGEQTLWPDAAAPAGEHLAVRTAVTGRWRWQSRSQQGTQVRVETEDWELAENSAGAITGTVARTVTIFDAEGQRYDCSGDTFYRYRDQYTVRGHRTGARIGLHETAALPEQHPCLVHKERHLDAAVGELSGDYVVLTWRGDRTQILHSAD
jgi:hypothetical protein